MKYQDISRIDRLDDFQRHDNEVEIKTISDTKRPRIYGFKIFNPISHIVKKYDLDETKFYIIIEISEEHDMCWAKNK